jgi:hypothetical protein
MAQQLNDVHCTCHSRDPNLTLDDVTHSQPRTMIKHWSHRILSRLSIDGLWISDQGTPEEQEERARVLSDKVYRHPEHKIEGEL